MWSIHRLFFPTMDTHKPKGEMTDMELQALEDAEFQTGPLSLLTNSVKNHDQILVMCRYAE